MHTSQGDRDGQCVTVEKHADSVNILDLPHHTLSLISSLVSEAPVCPVARLAFQVTCKMEHWQKLNALRETCRAFRDATRSAVAGLQLIRVFNKDAQLRDWEMPLSTAMSLPCLVALDEVFGEGLSHLVRHIKGLRYIAMGCGRMPLCRDLVASNSATLRIVRLANVDADAAGLLISSLTAGLIELDLEGLFTEALCLPRDAAATVRKARMHTCDAIDNLFLLLMESGRLESLSIYYCRFRDASKVMALSNAVNLRKLVYWTTGLSFHFESALAKDPPRNLQNFEYYPDLNDLDISILIPMLMALSGQLRKLSLTMFHGLREEYISPVANIPLRDDCEVSLSLDSRKFEDVEEQSVRPLFGLTGLRYLKLSSLTARILHLSELDQLPNLQTLELFDCYFDVKSIVSLSRSSKALTNLNLIECRNTGDGYARITDLKGKSKVGLEDVKNNNFMYGNPRSEDKYQDEDEG